MTPNETRLNLAALEGEARRHGGKLTWELEPRTPDQLDPEIFPRGHDYYKVGLTVTAPDFYSGMSGIFTASELAEIPDQARRLIQELIRDRAHNAPTIPQQSTLALFDDPPAEVEDTEEPEPEDEDTPEAWELDTTPEEHGYSLFEINEAYIPYLFHGADSTGDMTEEEISLCDDFCTRWRVVSPAERYDGTPYTDEFNRCPALSLDGLPCRTAGVWCKNIEEETADTPAA